MKKLLLLFVGLALTSSTFVSCQSTGGHHHGGGYHSHNDDPIPAAVRRHQERMRR